MQGELHEPFSRSRPPKFGETRGDLYLSAGSYYVTVNNAGVRWTFTISE
jgi:hypothetical protein